MKIFGWIVAVLAALAFAFSFYAETRIAPLVGAVLLFGSIAYATWITQTSDRKTLLKAERATRNRNNERARSNAEEASA